MAMVSYTTLTYYKDTYLMGRSAKITDALFPYYALKATKILKQYTFNNVDETVAFTDSLQMCCCEVAEYIHGTDSTSNVVGVSSESVGDYSVSYEDTSTTDSANKKAVGDIVALWLADTGLLYRGVK